MKVSTVIIGMIIFSGLTIGLTSIYTGMVEKYDIRNTTSSAGIVGTNATNQLQTTLSDIENKTVGIAEKMTNPLNIPSAVLDASTLVILDIPRLILEVPNILNAMIMSLSGADIGKVGVPPWFITMIIAIVTVSFIFAILSLYLKRDI